MIRFSNRVHLLFCGILSLCAIQTACDRNRNQSFLDACPPCPNNTSCIDGDCGCPTDYHDMGSWCLQKRENLFVAASLECPCIDVIGLFMWDIQPETGNGSFPTSSYELVGRGKPQIISQNNFAYYQRADGDSIVIYNLSLPGSFGYSTCYINDSLNCKIDLFGKFHGPDTIQTQVLYRRCRINDVGNNYKEIHPLTFVRKK